MITTERFVFIHMHKTGGQTLNDIIGCCISDHRVVGYHYPRSEIPPESTDLPLVGMVRNPWDWYVSWYAFNKRPNIHNQLFTVVSDGGHADFKSTVTNLINLGSDSPASKWHRDDLIRILPESLDHNRGVGLTKNCIRNYSDDHLGYYSWLFDRMLGNANDDQIFIGKFENLRDDFLDIMGLLSVKETEALKIELDKRKHTNVSRHSHYSHYYDDELRHLVAKKEGRLIEKHNYEFENIKPSNVAFDFPADLSTEPQQGFRKLLGRERNYLLLHRNFDVEAIRNKIEHFPEAKWLESESERRFDVHRDTQALLLIHFEDYESTKPDYRELYFELQNELKPLVDYIANYYQNNGFVVRLLLAKLLAGGKIPNHTDAGYSLLNCHRIHIPITTNDKVVFVVGGEEKSMQVGELWEINNESVHAVENRGEEDRIHLIIDWMPNYAGQSEEDVLASDQFVGTDGHAADTATLNVMVDEAHRLHRSGQVSKAQSIYRQVLDIDDCHVIGNNLLGLLCLQTKRFDLAVSYIEKALAAMPGDAQAHSNLGLALKDLNRPEEAARHFHESLKLVPNNPKTYNNLGNVYRMLGCLDDSIASYRQALVMQPAYAEAHHNLGDALMHIGRFEEAVASLQQSLALKPRLAKARVKLEQALRGLRNQERAPHSHG